MGRKNDRWAHGTTFRIPAPYLEAVREAADREEVPQREIVAEIMSFRAHDLDMTSAIRPDPGDTLKEIAYATGRSHVAEAAMSIDLWLRAEGYKSVRHVHPECERWTERVTWQS